MRAAWLNSTNSLIVMAEKSLESQTKTQTNVDELMRDEGYFEGAEQLLALDSGEFERGLLMGRCEEDVREYVGKFKDILENVYERVKLQCYSEKIHQNSLYNL